MEYTSIYYFETVQKVYFLFFISLFVNEDWTIFEYQKYVYTCVRGIDFPLSTIFWLDFGTVPTVWYFHYLKIKITCKCFWHEQDILPHSIKMYVSSTAALGSVLLVVINLLCIFCFKNGNLLLFYFHYLIYFMITFPHLKIRFLYSENVISRH